MSDNKHIDDLFRKGLEGQKAAFNEAHWANMEQMLDQSKGGKRRFGWLILLFLTGAGLALLLGVFNKEVPGRMLSTIEDHDILLHTAQWDGDESKRLSTNAAEASQATSSIEESTRVAHFDAAQDSLQMKNANITNKSSEMSDPISRLSNASAAENSQGETQSEANELALKSDQPSIAPNRTDDEKSVKNRSISEREATGNTPDQPNAPSPEGMHNHSFASSSKEAVSGRQGIARLNPLTAAQTPSFEGKPFLKQQPFPKFSSNYWELRARGGVGASRVIGNEASENVPGFSLGAERGAEWGLEIAYLKNGWEFTSGLNLNKYEAEVTTPGDSIFIFEYEYEFEEVDSIFVVDIITVIDSIPMEDSTEWVVDTTFVEVLDTLTTTVLVDSTIISETLQTEELKSIQQHSVVEIPLMVGKRWEWKRWQFGVRLGPSFQINTTINGVYLSDGQLLQRDAAVKTMSVSIRGEGHIGYTLSDRWGIYISGGGRAGISPFIEDSRSGSVRQRKNQLFLAGGLSYRF